MNNHKNTLSNKTLIGYSAAGMADAGLYNFVFMYFLFFLTNIAGVKPAFAGTIVLVATLCDIIITPIVSQISDNSKSKFGRRRKFILLAAIPIFIVLLFMFSVFDISEIAKNIYYMAITIVFWISFGVFVVPYYALAPELTNNQEERTKLRIPFIIFNALGNLLGMTAPMSIVAFFVTKGFTDSKAWFLLVLILGAVFTTSLIVTFISTKGKEVPPEKLKLKEPSDNVFVVYGRFLKLKPTKYLVLISAVYTVAYGFILSGMSYFILYNLGGTETNVSLGSLILVLVIIIIGPIVCGAAIKYERNKVLAISMFISAIIMIIIYFTGITNLPILITYLFFFAIANSAYWGLVQAMFYDLAEVYEYKYGRRQEGAAVGLNIITLKVFASVAVQILGIVLQFGGYNPTAEVQTETALNTISYAFTIIPAILIIVAGVFALLNPINKNTYPKLINALNAKKDKKDYSTEGLEKIL